ncbi:MAG: hypothetical protein U5N55_01065 [Cypionkella sp.]|nr:hypothetical protein [Cypionkella sp.]
MIGAVVMALRPKECPQQDIDHIASIYRNLSPTAAQQVVASALAELAQMMATVGERIAAHDLRDLQRSLRQLQRMAQNLGLITLAKVSGDLSLCLQHSDATAFAAVWARLLRVVDCTLTFDQEMQDLNAF